MPSRSDEPAPRELHELHPPLESPAERDLSFTGPGLGGEIDDLPPGPDVHLPGGVDHTTAAVGGGGLGLVLLGIAGALKRRKARHRYRKLRD